MHIIQRLKAANAKLIVPIGDENEGKNRLVQVKNIISGKFINSKVREKLQTKVFFKKFPIDILKNLITLFFFSFWVVTNL